MDIISCSLIVISCEFGTFNNSYFRNDTKIILSKKHYRCCDKGKSFIITILPHLNRGFSSFFR